jgi:uncharacterized protein (UPF0332 family)
MNPREFQSLALKLVAGNSAAEFRTAISRAYYATFHVSVELLESMGFKISRGPAGHGDVQAHLSNGGVPEIQAVGQQLSDLHSKRIQADYRLNKQNVENQKTASVVLEQASRMIQTLDEFRVEPKRGQVINGIQQWLNRMSQAQSE